MGVWMPLLWLAGAVIVVKLFVLLFAAAAVLVSFLFCFIPCSMGRRLRWRCSVGVRGNRLDW